MTPLEVRRLVQWAGQECEWQMSGEQSVARLIDAYFHLADQSKITERVVLELGHFVIPPTDLFRQFEEIHPFRDGNGRVGALLFNWFNDTYAASDLLFPPNLWNDARREGVTL